jgi:ligand-binding sensor domain-containing protein/PAS domain-containing protein
MIRCSQLLKALSCFFLFVVCISIAGQVNEIKFDHLSVEDGLSQGNALVTIQDSKGFIWIGTEDGLNLYDGYRCKIYRNDPRDPKSISSNFVRTIVEDKNGDIWIGTQSGLNRYDRDKDNFTRMMHDLNDPNSIITDGIQKLFIDSKNRLWVSTQEGINLFDIKTRKMELIQHDPSNSNSIASNYTRDILEDSQGRFWIATYSGLSLYNEGENKFTNYQSDPSDLQSLSSDKIQYLFEDSHKRLWVGTFDNGLNLMNVNNGTFQHFVYDPTDKNGIPNNLINCIAESSEGIIWVGTSGGLCIYNEGHDNFTIFLQKAEEEGSLSSSDISNICFDVNNRMWVGTRFGGVNIYDKGKYKFLHYKNKKFEINSLSNNNVTSFAEDELGNVWIGTDGGGLNYFNRRTNNFSNISFDPNKPNGLTNNKILALRLDSYGELWIGTWAGGVNLYNRETGKFKHYMYDPNNPTSIGDNNIFYIYEDSRKEIWICTWGNGINKYNRITDDFTRFTNDKNDSNSFANSASVMMIEDFKGYYWIATEGAGLIMYDRDKNKFIRYGDVNNSENETSGLSSISVYALYEDTQKRLWIGTNGGGLDLFNRDNNTFKIFRMRDGLPNDAILGILEDDDGNLWLSTNEGLCKFNPNNITFKNYNASDGLQSNQFGRWAFKSLSTGELMFGGVKGFNIFDPKKVIDNSYKPPVYITGFKLFNEDVEIGEKSVLKHNILTTKHLKLRYFQNIFSFEYTALNYRQSEKNQYMYMMEGFNDEWINAKNERKVSFTNLDPGNYVFRVKASNNDGIWNEEGVALDITIVPPFWKTWWFRILVLIIIGWIVYSFIKLRNQTIKRDKDILQSKIDAGEEAVQKQKDEIESQKKALFEKEEAEKENNWMNEGMTLLGDIISKNNDDLYKMAQKLMSSLVEYVGASLGVFYIINANHDSEESFELAGQYGIDQSKIKQKFEINEGYLGACYQEKKTIIIDNLPENYTSLESGLGKASLKHLTLIPLILDNNINGVMELATLDKTPAFKLKFLEKLADNLASSIEIVKVNERMKIILEQLNSHTEELNAQKEEMQQNLEEMTATNEEMERVRNLERNKEQELIERNNELVKNQSELKFKTAILDSILENINDQIIVLDKKNRFLLASRTFIEENDIQSFAEIKDKSIGDAPIKALHSKELIRELKDVSSGDKIKNKLEKLNKEDKTEYWLSTSRIRIDDENKNIIGLLSVSSNISQLKELESQYNKLLRKYENLKKR